MDSNVKRIISIIIIIGVALGIGWYLFKISPSKPPEAVPQTKTLDQPLPVTAEDFILGNRDAKNTLIVFEDFQCPACSVFEKVLQQVPQSLQDTKVVFRIFPLTNIHKNSLISAHAAFSAGAQGKFWEYANILFEKQRDWENLDNPLDIFAVYAQAAGVGNIDQFKNDIVSQKYKAEIYKDEQEAMNLALPGTPSAFFNGTQIEVGDLNEIKSQAEKLYK